MWLNIHPCNIKQEIYHQWRTVELLLKQLSWSLLEVAALETVDISVRLQMLQVLWTVIVYVEGIRAYKRFIVMQMRWHSRNLLDSTVWKARQREEERMATVIELKLFTCISCRVSPHSNAKKNGGDFLIENYDNVWKARKKEEKITTVIESMLLSCISCCVFSPLERKEKWRRFFNRKNYDKRLCEEKNSVYPEIVASTQHSVFCPWIVDICGG